MPNIFVQDLVQLGPIGLLLSLAWIGLALLLCITNASRVQPRSKLASVNSCAAGVLIVAFYHANVDSFWSQIYDKTVAFAFLGMVIFVRIALDAERAQRIAIAEKLLDD